MFLSLFPNVRFDKIFEATIETLYMTTIPAVFVFLLGLIIGLVLFLTSPKSTIRK